MDISSRRYRTFVFDCDGVLLNSNRVKTNAFYQAALAYGESAASKLVRYHVANGGISRYAKFAYFLESIVPRGQCGPTLDELLVSYAKEVRQGLMVCEVAERLAQLREQTPGTRWLIVSGSDQNELRDVFHERGLDKLFDGGIFGSPASKEQILDCEIGRGNIRKPCCFFGDSRYDLEAAQQAGLDFIFVRKWSEWSDWQAYRSQFTGMVDGLDELLSAEIQDETR